MEYDGEKGHARPLPSVYATALQGREATEDEIQDLPHIVGKVPFEAWAAALLGAAERFGYYSTVITWQNYMQNQRGVPAVPGALGLGQSTATAISNVFFIFQFLSPLLFAFLSDIRLGRYNTLLLGLCLSLCGNLVMLTTSLPVALDHGAGFPGLIAAMVLIALGVGAIKATISPFIGDQLPKYKPQVVVQKDGTLAVENAARTLQLLYNAFYWFTNIASLSSIPATFLERQIGFWTSYLMACASLFLATALLILLRSRLVRITPGENCLPQAFRVLRLAARNGFHLDHAKRCYQQQSQGVDVPWEDSFVDQLKEGLLACRIIFSFSLFYLAITQMHNNLISQAGQMNLHGVPNDMIQAMAGVACVIFGPIIQSLYNFLAKRRIAFGPIKRIAVAFLVCGGAMAYASGLQKLVYNTGPCYNAPLKCPASDNGSIPNDINVWTQLPVYVTLAIAEIFGLVTASQYSYSHAPKDMRSVVQAVVQLSACLGSVLGIAISPAARDPWLVIVYASIAGALAVCSILFWCVFRKHDVEENAPIQ
ncbi:peptide transporter ptr2 [Ascochyta rabiei]|uniref:peptide transporter ptr2 n=1 Tax=Didymella rabiei TaxID=5454 RepID=UPI0022096CBD|nr:peptide transporter ptr2 [Ascochyta rabiei]UPX19242.1 peptide transporter ptr2 [Ascochyta rabiei]